MYVCVCVHYLQLLWSLLFGVFGSLVIVQIDNLCESVMHLLCSNVRSALLMGQLLQYSDLRIVNIIINFYINKYVPTIFHLEGFFDINTCLY